MLKARANPFQKQNRASLKLPLSGIHCMDHTTLQGPRRTSPVAAWMVPWVLHISPFFSFTIPHPIVSQSSSAQLQDGDGKCVNLTCFFLGNRWYFNGKLDPHSPFLQSLSPPKKGGLRVIRKKQAVIIESFTLQRVGHSVFCLFLRLWHLGWVYSEFNTLRSKKVLLQLVCCSASGLVLSCLEKLCSISFFPPPKFHLFQPIQR